MRSTTHLSWPYLLAIGIFAFLTSCGVCISNACRYDLSHKVHVPQVDNQSPSTNLSIPLLLAVKTRLNRVGIDVVDNEGKGAVRLIMGIYKADMQSGDIGALRGQHVGLDSNITEVVVTLQGADGKVVLRPERFRVNENVLVGAAAFSSGATHARPLVSSASKENFRRSELDSEVARLAKAIVQHFFGKKERK